MALGMGFPDPSAGTVCKQQHLPLLCSPLWGMMTKHGASVFSPESQCSFTPAQVTPATAVSTSRVAQEHPTEAHPVEQKAPSELTALA